MLSFLTSPIFIQQEINLDHKENPYDNKTTTTSSTCRNNKGSKIRKIGKEWHLIWKQQKMSFEQTYHKISKYILEPQLPSLHTVIELSRLHMIRYN